MVCACGGAECDWTCTTVPEGAEIVKGVVTKKRTEKVCPKCGTLKSGKRSCCFRGGAWFKKCGDTGDSKFEHTWFEGIQACTRAATAPVTTVVTKKHDVTTPVTTVKGKVCDQCGIMKSGKFSCCARGGVWFKKCGDIGDSNFEHTWFEGIQACSSFSAKSHARVVPLHGVSDTGVTDCPGCRGLSGMVSLICLSFIIMHML